MRGNAQNPGDFEVAAVEHLRLLGFDDVDRTPPGTEGIDARGRGILAQVKARSSNRTSAPSGSRTAS